VDKVDNILIPTEGELYEREFKWSGTCYEFWTDRDDEFPVHAIYYYPGGVWKLKLRMEWADIYPKIWKDVDTLLKIIK
jgi:hypothetical protein